jgi:hypothetical protein
MANAYINASFMGAEVVVLVQTGQKMQDFI